MTSEEFQVSGRNAAALFTLKLHRGDGMTLITMNWKDEEPPQEFVGFAIEYKEPGGAEFFPLKNRLGFPGVAGEVNPKIVCRPSSRRSRNSVGCTSHGMPSSLANLPTQSFRSS